MILPLIPGHRKPTLGELRELSAVGFSIGSKGYIGTGNDGIGLEKISGNMILPPIPGHRKPTSGEQQDSMRRRIFHWQQRVYRYWKWEWRQFLKGFLGI